MMVLGIVALAMPACIGEPIDTNEEEIDEAKGAMCDALCDPPPPSSKPDLVVVEPPRFSCGMVNDHTVRVTVKNAGAAYARSSSTKVSFTRLLPDRIIDSVTVTQSIPALYPDQTADFYFTTPGDCSFYECSVFLDVDWFGQVSESNESNQFIWRC